MADPLDRHDGDLGPDPFAGFELTGRWIVQAPDGSVRFASVDQLEAQGAMEPGDRLAQEWTRKKDG